MAHKMRQVQIDERLFVELCKYHIYGIDVNLDYIKRALEDKINRIQNRELYTTYKDCKKSDQEREKARQQYLDNKGILQDWRW